MRLDYEWCMPLPLESDSAPPDFKESAEWIQFGRTGLTLGKSDIDRVNNIATVSG
jgi:hypothetical protein